MIISAFAMLAYVEAVAFAMLVYVEAVAFDVGCWSKPDELVDPI